MKLVPICWILQRDRGLVIKDGEGPGIHDKEVRVRVWELGQASRGSFNGRWCIWSRRASQVLWLLPSMIYIYISLSLSLDTFSVSSMYRQPPIAGCIRVALLYCFRNIHWDFNPRRKKIFPSGSQQRPWKWPILVRTNVPTPICQGLSWYMFGHIFLETQGP